MPRNPVTVPTRDKVVNRRGLITSEWSKYLSALSQGLSIATATAGIKTLTDQAASIATTAIPIQTLYTAAYRVSYYARITQAATTSSSLTVTIGWTEDSGAQTISSSAITGNTTATKVTGHLLIPVDGGANSITYATTYSSTGATPMQYKLEIRAEFVGG